MRALGLDVGTKRIGVAVSDPSGRIATPVETVEAHPRSQAVLRIVAIANDRGVDTLVVGLPLTLEGTEGGAVRRTRDLVRGVMERLDVALVEWDERLTSVAAERSLIHADVRREKRKEVIDQVAATMILQSYLDSRPPS
jgi:putative Holliday junction resolvase